MRPIVGFLIRHLVELIMLAVGLRSSWSELSELRRRPRLILRSLLVIDVLVPLLALLVVRLVPMPPMEAGMILLIAICPAAPLFLRKARGAGARGATALNVLLVASLLAPISVALWLTAFDRGGALPLSFPPGVVSRVVLGSIVLPLALGMLFRRYRPAAAERVASLLDKVSAAVLILAAVAVVALARPVLSDFVPGALIALAIVTLGSALMGHLAGGPLLADRAAVGYAAAFGNPAIALAIVARARPDLSAELAAPLAAYLLLRALALVPYGLWLKRARRRTAEKAAPSAATTSAAAS
jgi:BASS family bile acid:Na+ symporter